MMPGLGAKYPIQVEVVSKPREMYRTKTYAAEGLPVAPAIMVGSVVVAEGGDISEAALEEAVQIHLKR